MTATASIAWRELRSFFRLPVGWVTIALYVFFVAAVFASGSFGSGQPASLRYFFGPAAWLLVIVAPAISMRLLSEEWRAGTMEPLLTSPVSSLEIVAGKYIGAVMFLGMMLAPTLVFPVVLWFSADPTPDPGPMAAGYLSLVLAGMFYLAVGTLISAMTASQTLAFLGTFLALMMLMLVPVITPERLPRAVVEGLRMISIDRRVGDFAKGVIDTGHAVFFVVWSLWFVMLAAVVLESRRWR